MDTSGIELPRRRTRRRHAPEFRERVVQACQQPGVSIAAVALANGLNANMLRKWVIDAEARAGKGPTSNADMPAAALDKPALPLSFLPLAVTAPSTPSSAEEIRIEVQRGATALKVAWPTSAAADCAAWLREWLR